MTRNRDCKIENAKVLVVFAKVGVDKNNFFSKLNCKQLPKKKRKFSQRGLSHIYEL